MCSFKNSLTYKISLFLLPKQSLKGVKHLIKIKLEVKIASIKIKISRYRENGVRGLKQMSMDM